MKQNRRKSKQTQENSQTEPNPVSPEATSEELTQDEQKLSDKYSEYESNYSDSNFKVKIASTASKLGKKLTSDFLFVYCLLTDKDSPINKSTKKALLIGVLGYFILPIDIIPDYIPGAGLVDDAAALAALIASLEKTLDADIIKKYKSKAEEHLNKFLGDKKG